MSQENNNGQNVRYDHVKEINITKEMKASFLSYAMSVIVSRALPDVRDGLKPVHRRILYGMDELSLYPDRAYKKSARIVGDVMGKYHPHGDTAIYDAMVRMSQEFSYRYPLVNGHGNFGSIDGDGAAAMRYTEAKMHKITTEMLADIKKDTIDFLDNYDGSEREPSVLPGKFPNLLMNGATGIAVGMATNIPPHNLTELVDGIIAYMDDETITNNELMDYIQGPDFPTGGMILGLSGLRQAYETGRGSIKIRSKTDIIDLKNNKQAIIITEIPYQVNKSRLIEKIAELAKDKKIDGITDLRDESNRNGIRIVIELRRDANAEVTLNNLFKYTPLQSSFGINMLALVNNKPEVLSLKEMVKYYVLHQLEVLVRRTQFDLDKAKKREHIVEGLLKALESIDEIIETIKSSYDDAEEQLIERFEFSNEQAKAILEMRLRRLSGLELEKLTDELSQLEEAIKYYESILASKEKQQDLTKEMLLELKEKYGDERRTEIALSMDLDLEDEDLIPVEDVVISITEAGYAKRLNLNEYKSQHRGGRGVKGMKTNDGDQVDHLLNISSHDFILFFTNLGRVHKIKAYMIPEARKASKGLPLVNLLKLSEGEIVTAVSDIHSFDTNETLFFITKKGTVKRTLVSQFANIRSNGLKAIVLDDDDELLEVRLTNHHNHILLAATNGKAIRFDEQDIRLLSRSAKGVRGMRLEEGEFIIGSSIISPEDQLEILIVTANGYGKRTNVSEYRVQTRGGKGVKTLNITEKNGSPVAFKAVQGDEDLIITTDKGMIIRLPITQITTSSRVTQGVRLIKLQEGHSVSSIAIVDHQEDEIDPQNLEQTGATVSPNSESIETDSPKLKLESELEEASKVTEDEPENEEVVIETAEEPEDEENHEVEQVSFDLDI
jgi:DNA gyrase subunit A